MKIRILALWFLILMMVTACSTALPAAPQATEEPTAQVSESTQPAQAAQIQSTNQPQDSSEKNSQDKMPGGGVPPAEAISACSDKQAQDACEFTAQKGTETGVCEDVQGQLACSPQKDPAASEQAVKPDKQQAQDQPVGNTAYNTEQAVSDKAQGMTIAYDALAFLTGDLGSDSFFPPGKVADFWGFQYLRDNDPSQMGHAGDFLTSAALNMLTVLTADQRAQLTALASAQVPAINEYGYKRFVLMDAFRRLVAGDLPAGTSELDEEAVKTYSAELYRLDGQISLERAQLMGSLVSAFTADQRAYLDNMVGKGMLEWPTVEEPADIKGLDRDVKVAVMTYAADMFSWYAGSIEADVYFCPERHGSYFGSFYLKDIHAMNDPSYAIPTDMTGDMGETLLAELTAEQAQLISGLVAIQRPYLLDIVATRTQVATELRKYKDGSSADSGAVLDLMTQYGQLDGAIIYNLAVNFAQVSQSLSAEQKASLLGLREELLGDLMYAAGAYLYSQPVEMPDIPNTDFLFK
jgi:hypothetical protein